MMRDETDYIAVEPRKRLIFRFAGVGFGVKGRNTIAKAELKRLPYKELGYRITFITFISPRLTRSIRWGMSKIFKLFENLYN